jgi:hypothetical protein
MLPGDPEPQRYSNEPASLSGLKRAKKSKVHFSALLIVALPTAALSQ